MHDDERTGQDVPAAPQPYEPPAVQDLAVKDAPLATAPGAPIFPSQP